MADESLNFKFSLDLSDFDKAPDKIASALASIKSDAEKEGKNVDLAMSGFLQSLIKEREDAITKLSQELEKATKDVAVAFANMGAGVAGADKEYDKAWENMNKLQKSVAQAKEELNLLNEAEKEVSSNASFLNQLKMKAQGMDLYGKAMSMLPAPIANVIKSTSSLNKALLALTTNPIVMMIAGLVMAIKALSGYADMMANKFETWTIIFGTITEAVRKFKEVITAIITLDWKDFVYNLTTMFDGGAREIQKRNELLAQSERQVENEKLRAEIQVLNKRASNRKRSFDERIKAQKEANAKELKILENGLKDQAQAMRDFYIDNNLYHPEWNPKGLKTSEEEIDTAQRTQLNQLKAERMRLEAQVEAQKGLNEENLYKLRQQESDEWSKKIDQAIADMEKNIEAHRKRDQYQRQVREALQAEAERLQAMSTQTENMVIQSQIKEMADGIEKVTKEAQFKTKQAYEALDKTLVDEAKKLYNNEKAIYEGNPANEGKMFKAFKLDDYERQARQNIGYGIRKELISNDEISTIKKAVDDMTKKALENAKKVSEQVKESVDKLESLSNADLPAEFGGEISLGFKEYVRDLEKVDGLAENARRISEEMTNLERERLMLEIKLNQAENDEERVSITEKITKNIEATNTALKKAKINEDALKQGAENVEQSYRQMMGTINQISSGIGEIANELKGTNGEVDECLEGLQQMLSIVGKLASGDYIGAIVQVIVIMVQATMDVINSARESERKFEEWKQKMTNIYDSVAGAVYGYKQALIDAKFAEEELWSGTTINRMQKMIEKSKEAKDRLDDLQGLAWQQRKIEGVYGGSDLYYQMLDSGVKATNRQKIKGSGDGLGKYDMIGYYYNTLETGYQDFWHRGNLLKDVLASRNMEQIFNKYGEFNLKAYNALKKYATDAWEGLAEVDRKQLDEIAKVAEEYENYITELSEEMASWYSPLLDNMTDAWMNWLETGEDVMDRFKEYSSDTFSDILKDVLKHKLFDTAFAEFNEQIEQLTNDYLVTEDDEEYARQVAIKTDEMMKQVEKNSDTYEKVMTAYADALKEKGIYITGETTGETTGRNAEARGIARASQESVDENNARLAMMQQHTYSINANVAMLVQTSSQMLMHLQGIHENTNQLARLERIEKSLSNIETYGIRVA